MPSCNRDSLIAIAFALVMFVLAADTRLPQDCFGRHLEDGLALGVEEYGVADPAEAARAQQIARDRGVAPDFRMHRLWSPSKDAG